MSRLMLCAGVSQHRPKKHGFSLKPQCEPQWPLEKGHSSKGPLHGHEGTTFRARQPRSKPGWPASARGGEGLRVPTGKAMRPSLFATSTHRRWVANGSKLLSQTSTHLTLISPSASSLLCKSLVLCWFIANLFSPCPVGDSTSDPPTPPSLVKKLAGKMLVVAEHFPTSTHLCLLDQTTSVPILAAAARMSGKCVRKRPCALIRARLTLHLSAYQGIQS